MKNKQFSIFKWSVLAVCLLTAGCFYSCSSRDTAQDAVPAQQNRAFQAESAPKTAVEESKQVLVKRQTEQEAAVLAGSEAVILSEQETEASAETETSSQAEAEPSSSAKICYVYVCGEVVSPGVYMLPEHARIYEALDRAGGFTDQAAESWLNQAEPVADGMKLEVPSRAQVQDPAWLSKYQYGNSAGSDTGNESARTSAAASQTLLININTASAKELMTLKGIGASRAEDIIRYRKENGGFAKIEDIMKVPGIKEAAFQKIKENITV